MGQRSISPQKVATFYIDYGTFDLFATKARAGEYKLIMQQEGVMTDTIVAGSYHDALETCGQIGGIYLQEAFASAFSKSKVLHKD